MFEVELELKENPIVCHYDVRSDQFIPLTQEKFDELDSLLFRDCMIISIIRNLASYEEKCRRRKVSFNSKYTHILRRLYALAKSLDLEASASSDGE
jgi:hypothetical protein